MQLFFQEMKTRKNWFSAEIVEYDRKEKLLNMSEKLLNMSEKRNCWICQRSCWICQKREIVEYGKKDKLLIWQNAEITLKIYIF